MTLRSGEPVRVAVQRAAAAGEDQPADPRIGARLEEVDSTEHVGPGVEERIRHRAADVDLRRLVEHDLRAGLREVGADEAGTAGDQRSHTSDRVACWASSWPARPPLRGGRMVLRRVPLTLTAAKAM